MSNMFPASVSHTAPLPFTSEKSAAGSLHRIDGSHQSVTGVSKIADSSEGPAVYQPSQAGNGECRIEFDPVAIRLAHADNLIEHLQRWSEELDDRASRLHADIATHERRERSFRLWMQNRRAELEAKIAECERAQGQTEAIARRLAFSV